MPFGDLKEDVMLHVLIRGVDNKRIRRRLLEIENLDLSKAIRIFQNMEATASDLHSLVANKAEVSECVAAVGAVPEKRRSGPKARPVGDQEWGA